MKKILIVILSLVAALLILAAILPSSIRVERAADIAAPAEIIYEQVVDFEKTWAWSPWKEKDPEMEIAYGDMRAGVGASYSWKGNSDVGEGSMKITAVDQPNSIEEELVLAPMPPKKIFWTFEEIMVEGDGGDLSPQTHVVWALESDLDYPVGRLMGLMMDSWLGQDFEQGLSNLKTVAEAIPVKPKVEVAAIQMEPLMVLGIEDSVPVADLSMALGNLYGELAVYMESNAIEMAGQPLCVYKVWNPQDGYTILQAAIPVNAEVDISGTERIKLTTVGGGEVAKAVHMGAYEGSEATHIAIDEWVTSQGRQIAGAPWEVYVTDPGNEPDTSKWITEIYYPLN